MTRSIGRAVVRADIGILFGKNIDLIHRQRKHFGSHLAEHRIGALPYFRRPHLNLNTAVLIEHNTGGGGFERDGVNAGFVVKAGNSHTAAHRPCLICILFPQLIPVEYLAAFLQALIQPVRVCSNLCNGIFVPFPHTVLEPQINRIHIQFERHIIHKRFKGKIRLRNPIRAHSPCGNMIGKHGIRFGNDSLFRRIELFKFVSGIRGNGVAVGSIAALCGIAEHLARNEPAVGLPHRGLHMEFHRMARAGTHKGFLTRNGQLHTAAAYERTKVSVQRFIQDVLLIAEAAADIRLDNPYFSPVDSERLSAHAATDMRQLRGRHHDNLSAFHIRIRAGIFYMTVRNRRYRIIAFKHHGVGIIRRFFIRTHAEHRMLEHIARKRFV